MKWYQSNDPRKPRALFQVSQSALTHVDSTPSPALVRALALTHKCSLILGPAVTATAIRTPLGAVNEVAVVVADALINVDPALLVLPTSITTAAAKQVAGHFC